MPTTKSKAASRKSVNIEPLLDEITKKLSNSRSLKKGTIVVRATGAGGGDYALESSDNGLSLAREAAAATAPTVEIIGDARRIQSILAGQKDARAQFLAGGLRLRGDLRYFSDLALELGILKDPL